VTPIVGVTAEEAAEGRAILAGKTVLSLNGEVGV
jgi:hypothetical protein